MEFCPYAKLNVPKTNIVAILILRCEVGRSYIARSPKMQVTIWFKYSAPGKLDRWFRW
jgi:hypothetical protein